MSIAQTHAAQETASRPTDAFLHDPTDSIRAFTRGVIAIWPDRTQPKRAGIASLRARLMAKASDPFSILYRLALGAIDEGKPVACVVQPFRDFIAAVEGYAARRERHSAGVLAFPEAHVRHVTHAIREDAEADIAAAQVKAECIASLEKARQERLDAIAADERLVECYTKQLAQLRSGVR